MTPADNSAGATIRGATIDDATGIADLADRLEKQASYLLVSPIDPATGSALIKAVLEPEDGAPRSAILVAERDASLVGIALCREHFHPAQRGVIQLDLGVDAAHHRRGIGRALIDEALRWAGEAGAHRVQLTVIADNLPALALYQQAGFEIEGTLKRAADIDGVLHDMHVMAKLLGE